MQTCCRVDATAHAKWSIASKMLVLQQHWSVRWMRRLWAVAQCTHPAYVHPVALAGLTLQSSIKCTMVPLRFSSMARRWFSESAIGNWFPQGGPECADVKPSGTFRQCHLQRGSLGLTSAHSGHLIASRWWRSTCRSAAQVPVGTPPCFVLSAPPSTFVISSSAPDWLQRTAWTAQCTKQVGDADISTQERRVRSQAKVRLGKDKAKPRRRCSESRRGDADAAAWMQSSHLWAGRTSRLRISSPAWRRHHRRTVAALHPCRGRFRADEPGPNLLCECANYNICKFYIYVPHREYTNL